ncbi:CYTH domain-containing protein [Marinilactibacillus sp. XAAS-LB27]|uniref:CYTH domain-containing protein n=1 Tax=Marinilactibacillus sp. XAAS-LB27 TaxID=3114538 RepID=UPI002E198BC1|nr:CYTH domain-containing protein [Marinilactibacillus sp. XAAS-LB27]
MKNTDEVTVLVTVNYKDLHNVLIQKGFKKMESFELEDYYYQKENMDFSKMSRMELLSKTLILRCVNRVSSKLIVKNKVMDAEKILSQSEVSCDVASYQDAKNLLEALDFKQWVHLRNECSVYSNNTLSLIVQNVNSKYLFIEIEFQSNDGVNQFEDLAELTEALKRYGLPINTNNLFIKKLDYVFNFEN